jgi:hypothetical protein
LQIDPPVDSQYHGWSFYVDGQYSYSKEERGNQVFVTVCVTESVFPPQYRISADSLRLVVDTGRSLSDWDSLVRPFVSIGYRDTPLSPCYDMADRVYFHAIWNPSQLPKSFRCRVYTTLVRISDRQRYVDSLDFHMVYRKGIYFTGGE